VDLEKTIETQVIPRLLLAHRDEADACMSTSWMRGMDTSRAAAMDPVTSVFAAASAQMLAARAPAPAAGRARSGAYAAATAAHRRGRYRGRDVSQQCAAIAHLAVRDSADALVALLDSDLCAGLTPERIFLERLAPAARLLGEMWSNDIYSFTDVTVGLCRLRQAFEELRARLPDPGIHPDQFSVLVSPAPGDQHSFGAAMIAHLFTQASWSVFNEIRGDEDVLLRSLKARRFDLLGLSLNTDHALERLPGFVLKAKRESKNQDLVIMIGGSLIGARPEIARELGVLAALSDPYGAIEQAEHLVRRAARRM
jgi:methanogenic corrinoid protein MtbC1